MNTLLIVSGIILVVAILILLFGGSDFHFHRNTQKGKIRVACIGDSITNGCFVPGCFFRSYPARLQSMLGRKYHVENFGLNGRSVQPSADYPYSAETEYVKSLKFSPDIVIIMLGTNDTKKCNWISRECFETEYRILVNSYLNLASRPRVILCTPPWQRKPRNFIEALSNNTFDEHQEPIGVAIKELGNEKGLSVVDLHTAFTNRIDLLSYDGVHPNAKGQLLIAEKVREVI